MIKNSSKKFKNVKFKYSEAKTAFVEVVKKIEKTKVKPLNFYLKYYEKTKKDFDRLTVIVNKGKVFGPQPFLAIQTKNNRFIR